MRQVREILRLTGSGVSKREIARRLGLVPSTVREMLRRFGDAGLTWRPGSEVTDLLVEALFYKNDGAKQGHLQRAEPDWA